MSTESLRKRLEAATPTEWKAASGRGKYSVIGTTDTNGRSYSLAVLSAIPATHRKADADLIAYAPTDLRLALDVIDAAKELRTWVNNYLRISEEAMEAIPTHLDKALVAFEASE